jgi:hypothetical protein
VVREDRRIAEGPREREREKERKKERERKKKKKRGNHFWIGSKEP